MTTTNVTLDYVLALARRLRPVDQARLLARLAPTIEQFLVVQESVEPMKRPPLRGLLAEFGTAPSETEITNAQRAMWTALTGDHP
jgi:hypothetical protein